MHQTPRFFVRNGPHMSYWEDFWLPEKVIFTVLCASQKTAFATQCIFIAMSALAAEIHCDVGHAASLRVRCVLPSGSFGSNPPNTREVPPGAFPVGRLAGRLSFKNNKETEKVAKIEQLFAGGEVGCSSCVHEGQRLSRTEQAGAQGYLQKTGVRDRPILWILSEPRSQQYACECEF